VANERDQLPAEDGQPAVATHGADLPQPIADPDQLARLNIHRRGRLGGVLHEYERAA
jgi:hypothetical protein